MESLGSASLRPFLVFPTARAPTELRRSPGVLAVLGVTFAVVGAGRAWPDVTRSLECTTGALADGEVWRLATYVLPHERGWWHVVLNMALLALFGWQLERAIGTRRFLVVYLGSGVVGMAMLGAAHRIDAEHGLRGGASLAVFGVVAALTVVHAVTGGLRGAAMAWAVPTCLLLLVAAGALSVNGRGDVVDAGFDGFAFGFINHAFGMGAGALLGLSALPLCRGWVRLSAGFLSVSVVIAGSAIGVARWT